MINCKLQEKSVTLQPIFPLFMDSKEKLPLLGLTVDELKEVAGSLGMPAFTGKQIAGWIYEKGVASIDEMTNISKKNRELLAERYTVGRRDAIMVQTSVDGTRKYLFPAGTANATVETVFIPEGERATLCVSCQVGCRMNCLFCQTGKQGFEGHLSATDILNQIYSLPERDMLTNIVFMGQGEPMDNLDNVLRATSLLTADYGWAWSPKRITVSSVGVKNKLKRFLDESQCHVAISLHSPIHEQRMELMPAEKAMSIEDVVALLRCRINLIRFHQIPDVPLHGADDKKMEQLRDYLTAHGVFTTIRASRGQDIYAACGLLNTKRKQDNSEYSVHSDYSDYSDHSE